MNEIEKLKANAGYMESVLKEIIEHLKAGRTIKGKDVIPNSIAGMKIAKEDECAFTWEAHLQAVLDRLYR